MSLWFLLPTSLGQNVRPRDLSAPYPPVVMVIPVQTTLFYVKVNVTASLMRLGGSGRQESCPPFRYCESEVKVTQSCRLFVIPPGSSVHGDSPGQNTGVGCHALLQRIFPTQGSNPCLLHLLRWQADSLPVHNLCIIGIFGIKLK